MESKPAHRQGWEGRGWVPPYYFCAMARARAGGSSSHFDQSEQYCTVSRRRPVDSFSKRKLTTAFPSQQQFLRRARGPRSSALFLWRLRPSGIPAPFCSDAAEMPSFLADLTRKEDCACATHGSQGPRSSFRSRNSERKRNALKAATLVEYF